MEPAHLSSFLMQIFLYFHRFIPYAFWILHLKQYICFPEDVRISAALTVRLYFFAPRYSLQPYESSGSSFPPDRGQDAAGRWSGRPYAVRDLPPLTAPVAGPGSRRSFTP